MNYFVKRGEEQFGPYSLVELQQYVQSGNIAPGDLAKSEAMSDWAPVSQILGNIPAPVVAQPTATGPAFEPVSLPPNLHWVLLLLLVVITRQLFNWIWAIVLANWARRLINNNKPLVLVTMYPAGLLAGVLAFAVFPPVTAGPAVTFVAVICIFGGLIAYLVGIFSIRSAMEDYYNSKENIGLQLSGAMTFFFSTVYLEYHVNRIARWKKTGILP